MNTALKINQSNVVDFHNRKQASYFEMSDFILEFINSCISICMFLMSIWLISWNELRLTD